MKHKRRRTSGVRRVGRTLYRALVTVSALIVVLFCAYNALVRAPEQAAPPMAAVPQPTSGTSGVEEEEAEPPPSPTPLVRKEGFYTFLLVATDEGGGNTDTLMVAAYDTAAQTVGVVSIPRDTLVDRTPPKINGVYAREGMEGLRETVSDLIGIPIDYTVMVNLNGFQRLVNAVGGVDFYVPCDMDYDDPIQGLSIHYEEGMQPLTGQQAMEVCRFRKNNPDENGHSTGYSDVGRTQTQQNMLMALARKIISWNNITRVNGFVEIFNDYVDTDLSLSDMLYFASQAISVDLDGVEMLTLEGDGNTTYKGVSYCYALDPQSTLEAVNRLINPYTRELTLEDMDIIQP